MASSLRCHGLPCRVHGDLAAVKDELNKVSAADDKGDAAQMSGPRLPRSLYSAH